LGVSFNFPFLHIHSDIRQQPFDNTSAFKTLYNSLLSKGLLFLFFSNQLIPVPGVVFPDDQKKSEKKETNDDPVDLSHLYNHS